MCNQPLMLYVLAITIIKFNFAVIGGFRTVVSKQHQPRCRVVVSEWHTKDKQQTRDLFSGVCSSRNALADLRNDLWQVLGDQPPQLFTCAKRRVQRVLLPL